MDYYNIKKLFYTGNFSKVLKEISKFDDSKDEILLYYKNRSLLALKKYKIGSNPVFDEYAIFLESKDIAELCILVEQNETLFNLNLLACSQAIIGKFDDSLKTCVKGMDSNFKHGKAELLLTGVQAAILSERTSVGLSLLESYNSSNDTFSNENEIIITLCEAYINFHLNKEMTNSNFYMFSELIDSYPSWTTQLSLFNVQLQQHNLSDCKSTLELLESDYYQSMPESELFKADLLSNKITFKILNGDNDEIIPLRNELFELNPKHPLCLSNLENNRKIDELVGKYY